MDDQSWLERKLEPRLRAVARAIRAPVHLDIGSDHALLPLYLLASGQVERVIAVEKNQGPFARATAALAGKAAQVRLGDGLGPVTEGEVDSLSISGMGWRSVLNILDAHPERLPDRMVLQANDGSKQIREWAQQAGFHLESETMEPGFWTYEILVLVRADGLDPAYEGLPQEVALRYGPHLLRERHPLLAERLAEEEALFEPIVDKPGVRQKLEQTRQARRLLAAGPPPLEDKQSGHGSCP